MNWEIYDSKDLNASVKKVQSQKTERLFTELHPAFLDILLFTDHRLYIYFLSADFVMDYKIIDEVGIYILSENINNRLTATEAVLLHPKKRRIHFQTGLLPLAHRASVCSTSAHNPLAGGSLLG